MAHSMIQLLAHVDGGSEEVIARFLEVMEKNCISRAVDLAMTDEVDLHMVFNGEPLVIDLALRARRAARLLIAGWLKLKENVVVVQPSQSCSVSLPSSSTRVCSPGRANSSTSVASVSAALTSFTRRSALGKRKRKCDESKVVLSKEIIEKKKIQDALLRTHDVFLRETSDSPGFESLRWALKLVVEMQLDVYRMGSRSWRVIGTKANLADNFFKDLRVCHWRLLELDAFLVAAWVRGRVSGGVKSAARTAKQSLQLVQAATEVDFFIDHPLVKGQFAPADLDCTHDEPAEKAKELDMNAVARLEALVTTASTPQHRAYCGFFALLGGSSLRATDTLRNRYLGIRGGGRHGSKPYER